ncbi:MAG: DUF488 domain-containing protein [Alphaproteobacteria bacterium]|nr:DUF488 domain-containing protein [Alphaproteobacteria bacterium]
MTKLSIKRVYEPRARGDGTRVLVDRIWPRGLRKEELADVIWLKEIAPSTVLRRWFAHDPARWRQFCTRYRSELDAMPQTVETLRQLLHKGPVTLLYSARDTEHNQAVALRDYLLG